MMNVVTFLNILLDNILSKKNKKYSSYENGIFE